MHVTRQELRWVPFAAVAGLLALAALAHSPGVVRLARGALPVVPRFQDLPADAAWSVFRMFGAYVASLLFAWGTGYAAASSPARARVVLPLLDIAQSVPVLGFFPAAIFVFIHLLGGGRPALELASIFLIFTSQAWNMAFAVYEGLSTIPGETRAAVDSFGVRGWLRFRALLLPACVPALLYNSILSWSNGWYFLIACEIIVAGRTEFDLPGLGSTLSGAIAHGDIPLVVASLAVLILIVLALEFAIWRPLRVWSQRFRYDTQAEGAEEASFHLPDLGLPRVLRLVRRIARPVARSLPAAALARAARATGRGAVAVGRGLAWPARIAAVAAVLLGVFAVLRALAPPWPPESARLPLALLLSFLRITAAYAIALLWIVPVTLWASDHPRGQRALSLAAQVGASIPATAFFPVLVALLVGRGGSGMEVISIVLALTGMQWYLLFNMMAGVQRVPNDLRESLRSLGLSRREIHRRLVLPACMPSLVTGSVVAWGGAWNALILSEYVVYRQKVYEVTGIGALLNRATFETGSRSLLFLSVALLVLTVVAVNRLVWARIYRHVHLRYRLES